jgi:1,4-dihydroxy-6-naphthoate synthase
MMNPRMAENPVETGKRLIRLGHSPDADDAFMFYAIARQKIDTGEFAFEHVIEDIESLNGRAMRGELEVTALSFHAYAHVSDRYALLTAGSSLGFGYGPIVVSKKPLLSSGLRGKKIAVPGSLTTAALLLKLYEPDFVPDYAPFHEILDRVAKGSSDAGLLIHEGQLTYARAKLAKVVDLGEWWQEKTGLPLPLGADAVRKDLPQEAKRRLSGILRESIAYGLGHRDEALAYAQDFARGLDSNLTDEFVGMYVNESTLDLDSKARKAIDTLLEWGARAGILPRRVKPEYVAP